MCLENRKKIKLETVAVTEVTGTVEITQWEKVDDTELLNSVIEKVDKG